MLVPKLVAEERFELFQSLIRLSRYADCGSLSFRGVFADQVLELVVVDVVCQSTVSFLASYGLMCLSDVCGRSRGSKVPRETVNSRAVLTRSPLRDTALVQRLSIFHSSLSRCVFFRAGILPLLPAICRKFVLV